VVFYRMFALYGPRKLNYTYNKFMSIAAVLYHS
jgi:hypothetical protein